MSPLGTLLRGIRLGRRLDQQAMAAELGTTPRRVAAVEAGAAFPPAGERRRWAQRLGFTDLLSFDRHWRDGWARVTRAHRAGWIPVINKAPAGVPVDYHEFGIDSGIGFEYVPRSAACGHDVLFAVVVIGDSMRPAYHDGDLVIFRPVAIDESLPDGSAVFVRFAFGRDHACTFKSLHHRPDSRFDLVPENPAHQALTVTPEEIDRMAVAVERRPAFCRAPVHTIVVADEHTQDFFEE